MGNKIDIEQKHDELNEALLEWPRSTEQSVQIVYGYIRCCSYECDWDCVPVDETSNIILMFYANICVGGYYKEYRAEAKKIREVKKMEKENGILEIQLNSENQDLKKKKRY